MRKALHEDFLRKLDIIKEMAEYFGWVYQGCDASNGQIAFEKDSLIMRVWTTEMTVVINKSYEHRTFYRETIVGIEHKLEFIDEYITQFAK